MRGRGREGVIKEVEIVNINAERRKLSPYTSGQTIELTLF